MTIQKKSLISTLNTTKKAIVASSPEAGSAAPAPVKAGVRVNRLGAKAGVRVNRLGAKAGVRVNRLGAKAGKK